MRRAALLALLALLIAAPARAYKQEDLDRLKATNSCYKCDLRKADLHAIDLRHSVLNRAELSKANLRDAKLSGARLDSAEMQDADLLSADLTRANLVGANLNRATLRGAVLFEAKLVFANLSDADISLSDFTKANLSSVAGLETLRWDHLPWGIYGVREELRMAGERGAERRLTHSIMKNYRRNTDYFEGALIYFLFEWTCLYGLSPFRPLGIALGLLLVCTVVYLFALYSDASAGIWRHWEKDRSRRDEGQNEPERLRPSPGADWAWALWFSVLSAFHIGWRDLNVGNWIARMQPREYTLRATGWVRTVSGIQSLISVYLVALSVLTYFGRPFE